MESGGSRAESLHLSEHQKKRLTRHKEATMSPKTGCLADPARRALEDGL
jgi:hypothetical protein